MGLRGDAKRRWQLWRTTLSAHKFAQEQLAQGFVLDFDGHLLLSAVAGLGLRLHCLGALLREGMDSNHCKYLLSNFVLYPSLCSPFFLGRLSYLIHFCVPFG